MDRTLKVSYNEFCQTKNVINTITVARNKAIMIGIQPIITSGPQSGWSTTVLDNIIDINCPLIDEVGSVMMIQYSYDTIVLLIQNEAVPGDYPLTMTTRFLLGANNTASEPITQHFILRITN